MTAITDNSAPTYLGPLMEGISDQAKYMLVAGAILPTIVAAVFLLVF